MMMTPVIPKQSFGEKENLPNQLNTVEPLDAQLRYARPQKRDEAPTAMYGTPHRLQVLKMRGAEPCTAKE